MANQRDPNKQAIKVWLHKGIVAQLDAGAQRLGRTRSDVILRAIREHLALDPIPASAAQLADLQSAVTALAAKTASIEQATKADADNLMLTISKQQALAPAPTERKLSWRERISGRIEI